MFDKRHTTDWDVWAFKACLVVLFIVTIAVGLVHVLAGATLSCH